VHQTAGSGRAGYWLLDISRYNKRNLARADSWMYASRDANSGPRQTARAAGNVGGIPVRVML
jgi:hypothetical protein